MTACACMGPPGDCPCIRREKGLPVEITETTISPELFSLLSDDDKNTINQLKFKAFGIYFADKKFGSHKI